MEDDETIGALLAAALESTGRYAAVAHRDVEAGLRHIARARPDLVILDLLFRGRPRGRELVEALRGDPGTAAIPLILCTALSASELEEHRDLIERHGLAIVPKPFELDRLLDIVAAALDGRSRET